MNDAKTGPVAEKAPGNAWWAFHGRRLVQAFLWDSFLYREKGNLPYL